LTPQSQKTEEVLLDTELNSDEILSFERKLLSRIVGQDRAVRRVVNMYQVYLANMTTPGRPIGNFLFLGPTGSGKTRVVEASAEILFGSAKAFTKIDCAEFQHSHEIAKLIGSPPGYQGHRETPPMLTQEAIDQHQTEKNQINFILFDEIEKANNTLWNLLLGILDKATLTLGDNRQVDFSNCVIFMTSNSGAEEISELITGKIGFVPPPDTVNFDDIDKKIYKTAMRVVKRKFSPEFMNRIDRVVVFRTLTKKNLEQILDIELGKVQNRIMYSQGSQRFFLKYTKEAKDFLLREGVDPKYGARHLNRSIERHLVYPLSRLIATKQIEYADIIMVGFDTKKGKLSFLKEGALPILQKTK